MTNCPKVYKNLQCESFASGKKITSQMLRQFCKNDAYLYDQIMQLWDKTDPETRKRFFPDEYMDISKSFGIDSHILNESEKQAFGYLEKAYRFSLKKNIVKVLDFNTANDRIILDTETTLKENNDSLLDFDYNSDDKKLELVREDSNALNPRSFLAPVPVDKEITYKSPDTTTYKITKGKSEVLGDEKEDAWCRGPYKNWKCNTYWYVGFNHNKNYNIKSAWRKNPDSTDIPTICRAQTFVAENTGKVSTVSLNMKGSTNTASPCIVEIRTTSKNGYPTQKVLARTEKRFTHSGNSLEAFSFKDKAKIEKGKKYAIVVRSPLSNINHTYRIGGWAHSCFSSVKKQAYYKGDSFLSEDNGKSWIHYGKSDNFNYANGMHKPIDFGFEVRVRPVKQTGTKQTKTKVTKAGVTTTIPYKIIEKGDYYLYLKPIIVNRIKTVTITTSLVGDTDSSFTGDYVWEYFNPETLNWTELTDPLTTGENYLDFETTFSKRYNYVKLRLKVSVPKDLLYVEDMTNEEIAALGDSDLYKTSVKDMSTDKILKVEKILIEIHNDAPTDAYLRTLDYTPSQDQMLPACIWSNIDADLAIRNNADVEIDIVRGKTATTNVLFYHATDEELKPYWKDYAQINGISQTYNVNAIISNRGGFTAYLQKLNTPVYILPYTSNNTTITFFEDVELLEYPAYPLLGSSLSGENITVDWTNIKNLSQYGFTYSFNHSIKNSLASIVVGYYYPDSYSETSSSFERGEIILNKGDLKSNSYLTSNAVNSASFNSNADIDYALSSDGKTLIFNLKSDNMKALFKYASSSLSYNYTDNVEVTDFEWFINFKDTVLQEWVDYTIDYNTKTLTFVNDKVLHKGTLKIDYNPLFLRGLNVGDFPLKLDLWIEDYEIVDGGSYKLGYVVGDSSVVHIEDSFIATTDIDPYSKRKVTNGKFYQIRLSAPALDNLRKITINDDGSENVEPLVEDRDYFVDYINNIVTFRKALESGSLITVRYTPNLTDTTLSLAYRLHRPTYSGDNMLNDNSGVVKENITSGMVTSADDVYILGNSFTYRT